MPRRATLYGCIFLGCIKDFGMKEDRHAQARSQNNEDWNIFRSISLLEPPSSTFRDSPATLTQSAWHDLGIDQIVAKFTENQAHRKEISDVFSEVIRDPLVIRYRQDILEDFLQNSTLVERLSALLPVIDSLTSFSFHPEQERNTLHEVSWRIGELQSIIDCIEGLEEILGNVQHNLHSQGLQALLAAVGKVRKTPVYQSLVRNLPDLLAQLRSCASVTIGINLDGRLRPIQATLLSVNTKRFTTQSLLNRLFGTTKDNEGITPLHSAPQRMVNGPYAFPVDPELGMAMEPMLVPLFADLARVLEKTTAPIANKLKEYAEVQGNLLAHLRQSLAFYLGEVRFIRQLQAQNLPVCRPSISTSAERLCKITSYYNVNLALRMAVANDEQNLTRTIVTNDINIGPDGQILILTGPNQGGKTTYMVGIGIAQLLAQVGCFVPGQQAQLSPVDNIFTHFPLEEKPENNAGRFGEEAMRLSQIFEQVTRYSLVLLNESLSNTSFGESLYLAQDIVRILRRVGMRVIYSTHLHELAERVEMLNQSVPGESKIISLVSSPVEEGVSRAPDEVRRNYRVENRPPLGQSYAREIAGRYGIRYEQLEKILSARGVI
jgi:DNA mismatch repair protein MutS